MQAQGGLRGETGTVPVRIVHAADFHLDSAFGALSAEQSRLRRRESRTAAERLANYVNQNEIDIVLLPGDLFDGEEIYRETAETLLAALGSMRAQVFIAPGNHDCCVLSSPYMTLQWPENVHIFRTGSMERVELPALGCAVYGAAFTQREQETSLLTSFHAPDDGLVHLGVLHADLMGAEARYDPITRAEIAASGLDYLALGHVHECSGVQRAGGTAYAYCGCLEGRGFDELGARGFLTGTVDCGSVQLDFVPFARRRYELRTVDITGKTPEAALREALSEDTARDLYRIVLTGETDERGVDLPALYERFAPNFFRLELRDRTRLGEDIWARAEEDSLRGEFLRALRASYAGASEKERGAIERAARFGLAALDHRDL